MSGVDQGSMGSKELHYILRVLCPAACRNPELFVEVVGSTLRVALPPLKRGTLLIILCLTLGYYDKFTGLVQDESLSFKA